MKTEPKQPEIKATSFCVVCGTPVEVKVSEDVDEYGDKKTQYVPLTSVGFIKAAKMVNDCLNDGIPIEKGDPIHQKINQLLKEANAL